MKRNSVFTKIAALMLCVMMVIGCLPVSVFAADANEGEMDVMETKATLVIGDNELKVYTGMAETIYTYTAEAEGTLSITMPNYIGWSYTLEKGETVVAESSTADAEVIAETSIDVKAGDVVTLTVETNGQTKPVITKIVASFEAAAGIESNPYKVYAPGGDFTTIGADETMYFEALTEELRWMGQMQIQSLSAFSVGLNGQTFDATPVDAEDLTAGYIFTYDAAIGMAANLSYFDITNNGAEDYFYIDFLVKTGTMENPDMLLFGENTASVDANSQGYFYSYYAYSDQTLVFDMGKETNWVLILNGDVYTAASGTVFQLPVVANSEIEVVIGTENYEADVIDFTVSFPQPVMVAKNEQTGEEFESVAEALSAANAGETVKLYADSVEGGIIVPADVTLHLDTFTLTADYVIGFKGSYVRAGTMSGKLIVDKNSISLSSVARDGKNGVWNVIPVWIDETEDLAGHYEFGQIQLTVQNNDDLVKTDDDNGTAKLEFNTFYNSGLKPFIQDAGVTDHDLSVTVMVSYMEEGIQIHKQYVYLDDMLISAADNLRLFCSLSDCISYSEMKFTVRVISGTGALVQSKTYEY